MWRNKDNDKEIMIQGVMGRSPKTGDVYYESEDGTGIPEFELEFILENRKQDDIGRFGGQP
jgi:hypothetical protein